MARAAGARRVGIGVLASAPIEQPKHPPMRQYRIASIPADGIGPEVIGAGLEALDALAGRAGFSLAVDHYDWGSERYRRPAR